MSTHGYFSHVKRTQHTPVTILRRSTVMNTDDLSVFVDIGMDKPSLPEPFLRGEIVCNAREAEQRVMFGGFAK